MDPVKVARMRGSRRTILALIVVFLLQELVLWIQYGQMQGPFYPGGYDQVDYHLVLARMVAPDSPEGLLDVGIAQGWLLHILAWPLQTLGAPPAFAVHLPLLLLEAGLFWVALRQGLATAWLALGLFCSVAAHGTLTGGPVDYRHDYLSLILFGATALAAFAAAPFRRLGATLVAGFLGGLAVHARFITGAYLMAAMPWLLAAACTSPSRLRSIANLAMGLGLAALVALPFYLINRDAIHAYYLVGHLASDAEAQARGFGGLGTADFLSYYLRNVFRAQLGPVFATLAGLTLAVGSWVRWRTAGRLPWAGLLTVAGFLMPLLVLSVGLQRNHVVAQVMVLPVTLGVVALAEPMGVLHWGRRAMAVVGVLGLLSFPLQVLSNAAQVQTDRTRAQHHQALAGMRDIARLLPLDREVGVSVLALHEALSASMLRLLRFRETGRWGREIIGHLGHTVFVLTTAELHDQLSRSDVVLVPQGIALPRGALPSQTQLHQGREQLLQFMAGRWRRTPDLDFVLEDGEVQVWLRDGFELSRPG